MTDNEIQRRKLEEILLNTPTSTGFNVAVSALLATFVYMTLGRAALYLFVAVMLLVQRARVFIFLKARPLLFASEGATDAGYSLSGWAKGYWYATMATALIWSGMSLFTLGVGDITEITFALVVMAGICAGAVGTMSSLIRFFVPYVLIILLPSMAMLLLSGEQIQQFLAICAGLFGAFLISTSVNAHHRFEANTSQFYQRARMLNQLQDETSKLDRYAQEMKRMSLTDELTGLSNRRHFEQSLVEQFELARQKMKPLSLVICDINRFKEINDNFGHHAGDACLKQVARLLSAETEPPRDLVARLGGDEFVILLPGRPALAAEELVQRLEGKLKREHPDRNTPAVSMTFGISFSLGMPSDSPRQLLRRADEALYEAKRHGKAFFSIAAGSATTGRPVTH